MTAQSGTWVWAEERSAVGALRKAALDLARAAKFSEVRTEQLVIAVSEATSNLVKHAVEGVVLVRPHPERPDVIEYVSIDRGPGFADLGRALRDGYSTAGTLGVGLGAISRLASGYDIYSVPGKGTVLTMHFSPDDVPVSPLRASGLTRPIGEEMVCGDAYAAVETDDLITVALCDGLGHGPAAAEASAEAMEIFRRAAHLPPGEILTRVHEGIGHTRGGALAIARIGRAAVTYAGIGNVAGWIISEGARRGLTSMPGIAGHQSRTPREFGYDLPRNATVVLHSDGLTSRWNPATVPGLFARSPSVISAALLREAGSRRDDACVVAVKAAS
ncbi:ATP-binding protein [Spongiactinospora sp. TRM90649]|uniref:ATP-binding protein n=1 Tax=Spongiactinospora sp. TRM90649 TaxID=3031114 RepID=UPI0023F7D5C6|nr:ATP-binding protein [Spongiactinospora sp. TRM90649]MDF5755764.1 SpoIIE family protein phosphatase [Spongiactinospora sp. TRM90649]